MLITLKRKRDEENRATIVDEVKKTKMEQKRKRSRNERRIESADKKQKKSDEETAALSLVLDADIEDARKTVAKDVTKVVK